MQGQEKEKLMGSGRIIKFRAWDKNREKMVKVWQMSLDISPWIIGSHDTDEEVVEVINDFELMQFTGLFDKNGKEIYEGDIVKAVIVGVGKVFKDNSTSNMGYEKLIPVDMIEAITWSEGGFCLFSSHSDRKIPITTGQLNRREVIGNIFESKYLLDK